ncbi:MAG TPA: hypothetical protein PLQ67_05420, partial [Burkholderiaceae bacterium]|nr:hypothetical protein [Burkholderiaceae bacterium]
LGEPLPASAAASTAALARDPLEVLFGQKAAPSEASYNLAFVEAFEQAQAAKLARDPSASSLGLSAEADSSDAAVAKAIAAQWKRLDARLDAHLAASDALLGDTSIAPTLPADAWINTGLASRADQSLSRPLKSKDSAALIA